MPRRAGRVCRHRVSSLLCAHFYLAPTETQKIYFDKIMFWNADPSGQPDWGVSPPAALTRHRRPGS
jgi:hypothetical protein